MAIDLDDSIENSDWLKGRSWDLPTKLDALLSVIGFTAADVEEFLKLPAAKPMPESLQSELVEYLKSLKN